MNRVHKKYPTLHMFLCLEAVVEWIMVLCNSSLIAGQAIIPILWNAFLSNGNTPTFFPSIAISAHVTNWGKQSIKFKTDVAMMGRLGFDIVVDDLDEQQLQFCQNAIGNYKKMENTIWHGDLYRLLDPYTHNTCSLMYVNNNKNEAVLFSFLINDRYSKRTTTPIRLKGLQADKNYKIKGNQCISR